MSAPLTGHFDKCVKSFATQSSVGALVGVTAAAIFFSKCLPVCCGLCASSIEGDSPCAPRLLRMAVAKRAREGERARQSETERSFVTLHMLRRGRCVHVAWWVAATDPSLLPVRFWPQKEALLNLTSSAVLPTAFHSTTPARPRGRRLG